LIVLLSVLPVLAQNNFRVDASASAQGDVRRPVVVDVTVTNNGKEPLRGYAIVKFTPKVSSADRVKGGNTDVQEARQPVQLEPGAKQVVSFSTPFESASSFKGRKGSFRANNISPTGEVTIDFAGRLEVVAAPPNP
jgi:hypothetical protein